MFNEFAIVSFAMEVGELTIFSAAVVGVERVTAVRFAAAQCILPIGPK
jgi:hypothetical protein